MIDLFATYAPWPIKSLAELCSGRDASIQTGPFGSQLHASDYVVDGIPCVMPQDIIGGRIHTSGIARINADDHQRLARFQLREGDILYPRRGDISKRALIGKREAGWLCGTGCLRIRPNSERVDSAWLAYYLAHIDVCAWLEANAVGATMPHLNTGLVGSVPVFCAPLAEQRAIAAILGALDDKIEVNRKASAALEEMARALYRSWFVDFDPVWAKLEGRQPAHMDVATAALFPDSFDEDGLPVGWRSGKLSDVAVNPRNGVKPEQISPETPYIGLEHMPRRSITLPDWGTAADVGSQKSGMCAGDFLFGKLRPYFHKVGIAPVDGICSTDIIVVRPKTPEWAGFVLSIISTDEFVEHTNAGSSGTRMPRTNWSDMGAYEITMPPGIVASAYDATTKPWRDRIVAGVHENRTLAALRDTLLPSLMSGELRVGEARELVEEVA